MKLKIKKNKKILKEKFKNKLNDLKKLKILKLLKIHGF
jgi:hypothetical protein